MIDGLSHFAGFRGQSYLPEVLEYVTALFKNPDSEPLAEKTPPHS